MAKPSTLSWTKLTLWVGDGGAPEVFTSKVCGMVTKSFQLTAETSDTTVPDCDNPDAAAWVERVIRSLQSGFSGSGVMAEEVYAFFRDWFLGGQAKNVKIVLDGPTISGYYKGRYLLTSFETTGSQSDGKIQTTQSLQSDGEVNWQAGAP